MKLQNRMSSSNGYYTQCAGHIPILSLFSLTARNWKTNVSYEDITTRQQNRPADDLAYEYVGDFSLHPIEPSKLSNSDGEVIQRTSKTPIILSLRRTQPFAYPATTHPSCLYPHHSCLKPNPKAVIITQIYLLTNILNLYQKTSWSTTALNANLCFNLKCNDLFSALQRAAFRPRSILNWSKNWHTLSYSTHPLIFALINLGWCSQPQKKTWMSAYVDTQTYAVPQRAILIISHIPYKVIEIYDHALIHEARLVFHGNQDKDKFTVRKDSKSADLAIVRIVVSLTQKLGLWSALKEFKKSWRCWKAFLQGGWNWENCNNCDKSIRWLYLGCHSWPMTYSESLDRYKKYAFSLEKFLSIFF